MKLARIGAIALKIYACHLIAYTFGVICGGTYVALALIAAGLV